VKKCKQDAQSLYNETVTILEEWGLDSQLDLDLNERFLSYFIHYPHFIKISRFLQYFTSDTTNVMPALVSRLGMTWIPCAAHVLNLVVQGLSFYHTTT
jgi:hypothetical protein